MERVSTNIRLPQDMLIELKVRAAREGKSLAEMVREAVEVTYGIRSKPEESGQQMKPADYFQSLTGICETGIRDGALHHDRDLYGDTE